MDIIIVGGGASGLVAAIKAKNSKNRVLVLERNSSPLKKLLMTGNGRCNYLNETYSLSNYHSSNLEIVDQIISTKNIEEIRDFFDDLGIIPLVKNSCYYPYTKQSNTIKDALLLEAQNKKVEFIYNCLVEEISKKDNKFLVKTTSGFYSSDKLLLATGSLAYPKTGSDGRGYHILEKFHHTIIKPLPALVPVESSFKYNKEWAGVRAEVTLNLFEDDQLLATENGELQLTNYGLSGICIFNLSHYITRGLDLGKKEVIYINFVPFVETLVTPWLDSYSKKRSDKTVEELLLGFLNYKIVKVILKTLAIAKETCYKDLKKEEKYNLCKYLRAFPIPIAKTKSFDCAQICNGGVSLLEINQQTMESLKVKGLYIIGELLDINGNCGGYNLTACFISGMLAGKDLGDKVA